MSGASPALLRRRLTARWVPTMNQTPLTPPGADDRQLAVIVFTDVVGYSARMQQDETGTLTRLTHKQEGAGLRRCQPLCDGLGCVLAAPAFPWMGCYGIHVHKRSQQARMALLQLIGHPGNDHAAVAVTHQHHARQFVGGDQPQHVLHMRAQANVGGHQMRPFTHAGERHGMGSQPGRLQTRHHALPAPAAMPGTVYQNDSGITHLQVLYG